MPWLRLAQWDFRFNCCYEGNAQLAKDGIYKNLRYLKRFAKRQTDFVWEWAKMAAEELSRDRATYACTELAAKFSGCLIEVFNLRYSEVLIPEIKVVPPTVPFIEEVVPVRVPTKFELDQLVEFEKKLAEYEKKKEELEINRKVHNKALLRLREEDKPEIVKMHKGALTRIKSSLSIQETIIERQKKAIEDFKSKIGMK